jgi:hypothetical protein
MEILQVKNETNEKEIFTGLIQFRLWITEKKSQKT